MSEMTYLIIWLGAMSFLVGDVICMIHRYIKAKRIPHSTVPEGDE